MLAGPHASEAKNYSASDLFALAGTARYELIRGKLIPMPPVGALHGNLALRLARSVGNFVEEHQLGKDFTAETGFLVARSPDTVLAPDYAYIARERLPSVWPVTGFMPVAPDLVVEVRSPEDTCREVALKVGKWLTVGVKIVWEMDPQARVLTVHRQGQSPRALTPTDTLEGEEVLPGFELPLKRLFPDQ